MPKITIGTDVINFPDNGSDALWSPALIQFAEIVSSKLAISTNIYNIQNKVEIFSLNPYSAVIDASFDPGEIRKFSLSYSIYRQTSDISTIETGIFTGSYDDAEGQWVTQDEYFGDKKSDGKSYHKLEINNQNKIVLTAFELPGTGHVGKISFSATTELVSV